MKIVYYTDQTYLHGGIERVLANKVNYWAKEKEFETHIITTEQKGNPSCYPIDEKISFHDLEINYNRKKSYFNPLNFRKIFKHYWRLKKKIKELNPDVIIVCNFSFDFYFIPFISRKIPKIKEFHSSRYFEIIKRNNNKSLLKKINYKLNDYIESKYDYLVLLTEDEKKYYKSNNTFVIPNAIDNLNNSIALLESKKVMSAGRIAPVKGFEKLIQIWKLISDYNPDWALEIYGDGEHKYIESLQNLINSLGLKNKITLCGPTNDIEQKMLDASIYAMTSSTECFPMVLLESLACGLPIISFDCPNGPRNIITNNKDGFLIQNENIDDFAIALNKLINNHNLRVEMGMYGIENVKRFHPNIVMELWLNIFKKSFNK